MHSLSELATLLRTQIKERDLTQQALREQAGLAKRTLENVLSGQADYKVTTLMAILDRLGLELVVVPKAAAAGLSDLEPGGQARSAVKTRVQAAQEAMQARLARDRDADKE